MAPRTLTGRVAESAACDALVRRMDLSAHQRRQAVPHLVAAGLLVAGCTAALVAFLTGSPVLVAAVVAVVAFGAVAVAGTVPLVRDRLPARWRGRLLLAGLSASTWLTLAALGVGWGMVAVLLAGEYTLGAGWWREHRLPHRTTTATPKVARPVVAEPVGLERYETRFAEKVATHAKGVLGGTLSQGAEEGGIYSWALDMVNGETLADIQSRAGSIASLMGLPVAALAFDPWPIETGELGDESRIRMQILTASPVFEAVPYQVPELVDGRVPLGPWVDGRGVAAVPMVARDGVRHLVVIGSTGVGKSSTVNGVICSMRANFPTVTVYLDPKGNSSPDLRKNATVAVLGLDDAAWFTTAVERLCEGRRYESAYHDWSTYQPSIERPIYIVVLDECDMLYELKGMAARWAVIAKTSRSLGVQLVNATQYAGLRAFGGSEMLRSNMVGGGSVVLMRTSSNTSDKLIAPGLPPSRFLPADKGYAYLQAEDTRRVALRSTVLRSADDADPGVPHAGDLLARYPDVEPCRIGRVALGELLVPAAQREAANRAAVGAKLEAFLAGSFTTTKVDTSLTDAEDDALLGEVIAFPTALRPERLSDAEQAVLAAVRAGTVRPVDIQQATGYGETHVLNQLKTLVERGLVDNPRFGRYVPAGAEQQQETRTA